jgi:hypothetical protein
VRDSDANDRLKKEFDQVRQFTHCPDDAGNVLYFYFPEKSKYDKIGYLYDCKSEEGFVLVKLKTGEYFELDRGVPLYAKEKFEPIKDANIDYFAIIFGFEPNQFNDNYLVKVYDLEKRKCVVSLWSSDYPLIEDINGDNKIEIVIYKDIFDSEFSVVPGWPVIVNLQKEFTIDDLSRYPEFTRKHLELTEKELNIRKEQCKKLGKEYCNIHELPNSVLANQIRSLKVQAEYLKRKLRR